MAVNEKNFLQEFGDLLAHYADEVRALEGKQEEIEKMHSVLKNAVEQEKILREKYDIGVRFHVVKSQLQATLDDFEKNIAEIEQKEQNLLSAKNAKKVLSENEVLVYVYLFNAQGDKVKSWENLLLPSALQDHCINRPIYLSLNNVEEILRTRIPREQHAYIEISIQKGDILKEINDEAYHHTLLRLKEGKLKVENIRRFYHRGINYNLINGQLIPAPVDH